MTDTDTKTTTSRHPEFMAIEYENFLVSFSFADTSKPFKKRFALPIKAFGSMSAYAVAVEEDDIKKLCLEENHSLAEFEAIRLGIKAFLRDHETYVVNGVAYRVRREDILCEIATRAIKGQRVPKAEDVPQSEAAWKRRLPKASGSTTLSRRTSRNMQQWRRSRCRSISPGTSSVSCSSRLQMRSLPSACAAIDRSET